MKHVSNIQEVDVAVGQALHEMQAELDQDFAKKYDMKFDNDEVDAQKVDLFPDDISKVALDIAFGK